MDLSSQKFFPVRVEKEPAPDIRALLGCAIRARRQELGWSQEELAARAGLHRTYLADVERGSRNVALLNIEKIARALEISVARLFSFTQGDL